MIVRLEFLRDFRLLYIGTAQLSDIILSYELLSS